MKLKAKSFYIIKMLRVLRKSFQDASISEMLKMPVVYTGMSYTKAP